MNTFFEEWISSFLQYLNENNPQGILSLFSATTQTFESKFKDSPVPQLHNSISSLIKSKFTYQNQAPSYLTKFIVYYFLYKIRLYKNEYYTAYKNITDSFNNFCEFYGVYLSSRNCLLALQKHIISILYQTTLKADADLQKKKDTYDCVSDCGRTLISFFSKYSMNEENKLSVLYCVVCLMKIYFKLKTYRNSLTLITWFEKSFTQDEDIPKSEFVTFSFYEGRLNLYELKLLDAQRILTKAFELCLQNENENAIKNAAIIYEYLIPLNCFSGMFPRTSALNKFHLNKKYATLCKAISNGDLGLFERTCDELEERLIQLGTFLIIGKLRPYVYRNLIAKIYSIMESDIEKMKTPFIKIEVILRIMQNVYGYKDVDMEELELSIIGVLYRGLIGGYVHNANKVIVLSKKNPFPELKEVIKTNYSKII